MIEVKGMDYKQLIIDLLERIDDSGLLRRVWLILARAYSTR